MAINAVSFRVRTFTALVFAGVMLVGVLWNQWSFLALFLFIHIACWREYQKLIEKIDPEYSTISPYHRYGVIAIGSCFLLLFTNINLGIPGLSLHTIGL